MEVFLVFDNEFDTAHLAKFLKDEHACINLFPLTSNFLTIEKLQRELKSLPNTTINLLESAQSINDEVIRMQKNIAAWSSDIANCRIGNKNIKEWFLLPDGSGSSWWYSILSEKNAVQETVFFRIAQINAVRKQLDDKAYDLCLVASSDRRVSKIISQSARNSGAKVGLVPLVEANAGIKTRVFEFITQWGVVGALVAAAINWLVWIRNSRTARRTLPALAKRRQKDNPFLFISYFPNIDNEAAEQGVFRNKYALALQDKLTEIGVPVTWLLMPVFYNGHDFSSAMQLAKKFAEHDEMIFVLHEFFNLKVLLKSMAWWLRQSLLGLYLYARIDKKYLTGNLTCAESLPIMKYLWLHSFVGTSSVRGIVFYLSFREMFSSIPNIGTCLYYCEMQAWEKAFLHARKQMSPCTHALAFQHTVVGRNYYNYFYDTKDTRQNADTCDFPAPDLLIANGNLMYEFLAESNYPNLCQAEAIRQLYLSDVKQQPLKAADRPILFIGGSCDKVEMKSLITMLYQAYPITPAGFDIWIKASPVNPVEPLFKELDIDIKQTGYKIFHTDVSELIRSATVALIANTTVAIEAAAKGCPVIVPVFADTMLMNPIVGTSANYHLVSTVSEFRTRVEELLQTGAQENRASGHHFIEQYWNIDPGIPLWTNILNQKILCNERN